MVKIWSVKHKPFWNNDTIAKSFMHIEDIIKQEKLEWVEEDSKTYTYNDSNLSSIIKNPRDASQIILKTDDGFALKYWIFSHFGAEYAQVEDGVNVLCVWVVDELMSVFLPRIQSNIKAKTHVKQVKGLSPRYYRDPITKEKDIDFNIFPEYSTTDNTLKALSQKLFEPINISKQIGLLNYKHADIDHPTDYEEWTHKPILMLSSRVANNIFADDTLKADINEFQTFNQSKDSATSSVFKLPSRGDLAISFGINDILNYILDPWNLIEKILSGTMLDFGGSLTIWLNNDKDKEALKLLGFRDDWINDMQFILEDSESGSDDKLGYTIDALNQTIKINNEGLDSNSLSPVIKEGSSFILIAATFALESWPWPTKHSVKYKLPFPGKTQAQRVDHGKSVHSITTSIDPDSNYKVGFWSDWIIGILPCFNLSAEICTTNEDIKLGTQKITPSLAWNSTAAMCINLGYNEKVISTNPDKPGEFIVNAIRWILDDGMSYEATIQENPDQDPSTISTKKIVITPKDIDNLFINQNNEYEYAVFKTDGLLYGDDTKDKSHEGYYDSIEINSETKKINQNNWIQIPDYKYVVFPIRPIKTGNSDDIITIKDQPQLMIYDTISHINAIYPDMLSSNNYIGHFSSFIKPSEVAYLYSISTKSKSICIQNPQQQSQPKPNTKNADFNSELNNLFGFLYWGKDVERINETSIPTSDKKISWICIDDPYCIMICIDSLSAKSISSNYPLNTFFKSIKTLQANFINNLNVPILKTPENEPSAYNSSIFNYKFSDMKQFIGADIFDLSEVFAKNTFDFEFTMSNTISYRYSPAFEALNQYSNIDSDLSMFFWEEQHLLPELTLPYATWLSNNLNTEFNNKRQADIQYDQQIQTAGLQQQDSNSNLGFNMINSAIGMGARYGVGLNEANAGRAMSAANAGVGVIAAGAKAAVSLVQGLTASQQAFDKAQLAASNARSNQIMSFQNSLQNIQNTPSALSIPNYRLGVFDNILFRDNPRSHFEITNLSDRGLQYNFIMRNTIGTDVVRDYEFKDAFCFLEANCFALDPNYNTEQIVIDSLKYIDNPKLAWQNTPEWDNKYLALLSQVNKWYHLGYVSDFLSSTNYEADYWDYIGLFVDNVDIKLDKPGKIKRCIFNLRSPHISVDLPFINFYNLPSSDDEELKILDFKYNWIGDPDENITFELEKDDSGSINVIYIFITSETSDIVYSNLNFYFKIETGELMPDQKTKRIFELTSNDFQIAYVVKNLYTLYINDVLVDENYIYEQQTPDDINTYYFIDLFGNKRYFDNIYEIDDDYLYIAFSAFDKEKNMATFETKMNKVFEGDYIREYNINWSFYVHSIKIKAIPVKLKDNFVLDFTGYDITPDANGQLRFIDGNKYIIDMFDPLPTYESLDCYIENQLQNVLSWTVPNFNFNNFNLVYYTKETEQRSIEFTGSGTIEFNILRLEIWDWVLPYNDYHSGIAKVGDYNIVETSNLCDYNFECKGEFYCKLKDEWDIIDDTTNNHFIFKDNLLTVSGTTSYIDYLDGFGVPIPMNAENFNKIFDANFEFDDIDFSSTGIGIAWVSFSGEHGFEISIEISDKHPDIKGSLAFYIDSDPYTGSDTLLLGLFGGYIAIKNSSNIAIIEFNILTFDVTWDVIDS